MIKVNNTGKMNNFIVVAFTMDLNYAYFLF